jgi:hypothetical protein
MSEEERRYELKQAVEALYGSEVCRECKAYGISSNLARVTAYLCDHKEGEEILSFQCPIRHEYMIRRPMAKLEQELEEGQG